MKVMNCIIVYIGYQWQFTKVNFFSLVISDGTNSYATITESRCYLVPAYFFGASQIHISL